MVMSLVEVCERVKSLEYPHEKLPDQELAFSVIKEAKGVHYTRETDYIYLCKYKGAKHLGIFIIDRAELGLATGATGRYTMSAHVKSRRCDFVSPYQYWQEHKNTVIALAAKQLEKYKGDYTPEELPTDLGGTGGDRCTVALEHECAMALVRLGMPASFPGNLVTFMIGDVPDLRLLDISAGWGDRLMAACAMGVPYLACDPNTALTEAYQEIIAQYGNGKQEVHSLPFEDLPEDETRQKFNCLYCSPPFFDLEIYSTESTQSSNRYTTLDSWLNDFLKVCLQKADKMLVKGAYIYLHLNDIDVKARYVDGVKVSDERRLDYVGHIIEYVSRKLGWRLQGNYGYAIRDTEHKESETEHVRSQKNQTLLVPTRFVKQYRGGMRCNHNGQIMTQPIWYFIKSDTKYL